VVKNGFFVAEVRCFSHKTKTWSEFLKNEKWVGINVEIQ